jgi:hypothetical protein
LRHRLDELLATLGDMGFMDRLLSRSDGLAQHRFLNDDVLAQYAGGLSVADIESAYAMVIDLFSDPGLIGL